MSMFRRCRIRSESCEHIGRVTVRGDAAVRNCNRQREAKLEFLSKFLADFLVNGAPGVTRTPGLLIRSQTLYPTELRAHKELRRCAFRWSEKRTGGFRALLDGFG
jgi:hypothetical protein